LAKNRPECDRLAQKLRYAELNYSRTKEQKRKSTMYLIALLLPPLAVLMAGKPVQAGLNCLLTICLWVPGVIHAFAVVSERKAEIRQKRMLKGMSKLHR
jgi:uncharacterized membrane protein YqaE (UPF0057 family)